MVLSLLSSWLQGRQDLFAPCVMMQHTQGLRPLYLTACILASAVSNLGHMEERCNSEEQNMQVFFLLGTLRFGKIDLATAEVSVFNKCQKKESLLVVHG